MLAPEQLEGELKELIVETLMLDEVTPEEIDSAQPLVGTGLGLDSLDALEVALAIRRKWGVEMPEAEDENRAIFRNVHSLASFVREQTTTEQEDPSP